MATYRKKYSKPFDCEIEMGVLLKPDAIRAYAKEHGHAALGELIQDIEKAAAMQDGTKVLAFPIVEAVTTRPAGSGGAIE